jgi:hypothetical protein
MKPGQDAIMDDREERPRARIVSLLLDNIADDLRVIGPAFRDLLHRTVSPRRLTPITDRAALTALVDEHASHLAQSSVYAYCRARTGFMAPKLFDEATFVEGLDIAKWEAFAAGLSDLLVVVEGLLRAHLPADPQARADIFQAVYDEILDAHDVPAHRLDWADARESFARRIAWGVAGAPRTANDVAEGMGRVVFEFLPIHENMRRPDEEMVLNSVRFRMVRTMEDIAVRLQTAPLAASLAAAD